MSLVPTPVVMNVATLGPVGYLPKAPGTWGTLAAVPLYVVVFFGAPPGWYILLSLLLLYLGLVFCDEAARRMGQKDPSEVVLDEFVAFPLCFLGLAPYLAPPWSFVIIAVGFGLFRLLDATKPFGISKLQSMEGGLGILIDDVVAALATCVILHVGLALLYRV
jgi:phosphatidylglycerophosphatase A